MNTDPELPLADSGTPVSEQMSGQPGGSTPAQSAGTVWPPPPDVPPPGAAVNPIDSYISAPTLFRNLVVFLGLTIVMLTAEHASELFHGAQAEVVTGLLAAVEGLVLIVTGFIFLRWTYLASGNLRAFGVTGMEYTPGWAVGYFFVPILNVVRPYMVFSELWRASDPKGDSSQPKAWKNTKAPALLGGWWITYLVSGMAGWLSAKSIDPGLSEIALVWILDVISALLAIKVVIGIRERQELTYARVNAERRSQSGGA